MKKLFISVPMNGRTEENIRKSMEKMHKIAEAVWEQKLEVIPSYIVIDPPQNVKQALWFLGKSIQTMAEADYFIGIEYTNLFHGCDIERDAAFNYGIPRFLVPIKDVALDAWERDVATYTVGGNG